MELVRLKPQRPERTPARQALAEAIERHEEAKKYLSGLQASLQYDGPAGSVVRNARRAKEDAEQALKDVRTEFVALMGRGQSAEAPTLR